MASTASLQLSPCVGQCEIDARTGWCRGCRRTLEEIAAWGLLEEGEQQRIWDLLERRKEGLSR